MSKTTTKIRIIFIIPLVVLCLFAILTWNFYRSYSDKILPNVSAAHITLSGLTKEQAVSRLGQSIATKPNLELAYLDSINNIPVDAIDFQYNFNKTAEDAYSQYRATNDSQDIFKTISSIFNTSNIDLSYELNEEKLDEHLSVISEVVTSVPIYPTINYDGNKIIINKGQPGSSIDSNKVKQEVHSNLKKGIFEPVEISVIEIDPTLSEMEIRELEDRARALIGKSIVIKYLDWKYTLTQQEIFSLLLKDHKYDVESLSTITQIVSKDINREPQNPVFEFKDDKVHEFSPAVDGIEVNKEDLQEKIKESLLTLETENFKEIEIDVLVTKTKPPISTQEVNNLGIKELIGKGVSKFRGSITPRIHNIQVGSKKFDGVLIPPNTIFSFNDTIGDVSALTGYKQAYVIKDGKTVLGDGGGVCQVSTTLFRAALDAGLPITERRPHSYRVSYYELDSYPGLDATVYSPTTDLKFENNTPGHILIQTVFDSSTGTLEFELYGTSDGRKATTTKPTITSSTPPPEDLYIDDPNLPTGTVKQTEHAAWGAKVQFSYKVVRDNEILEDKIFYSNYRPWQAVYLRGTGPVQN